MIQVTFALLVCALGPTLDPSRAAAWKAFTLWLYHCFISVFSKIRGYSKKSVSWAVHLFFVDLYCCFIQKWCINNDWKCDFWYLRCLFYQVESILFHFQQLQIFVFQKFPWNTAKMVKNLQCLKTSQICYLTHTEHHAKNRTSLRGLDHDTLFFDNPL